MKRFSLHIMFLVFLLPLYGLAQQTAMKRDFFFQLGVKDATHEIALVHLNAEDEKDFWADQKAFEAELELTHPKGYQRYLNGKHRIYREHQIVCGERCKHSETFERSIAYYLIHGESEAGLVLSNKTTENQNQP